MNNVHLNIVLSGQSSLHIALSKLIEASPEIEYVQRLKLQRNPSQTWLRFPSSLHHTGETHAQTFAPTHAVSPCIGLVPGGRDWQGQA